MSDKFATLCRESRLKLRLLQLAAPGACTACILNPAHARPAPRACQHFTLMRQHLNLQAATARRCWARSSTSRSSCRTPPSWWVGFALACCCCCLCLRKWLAQGTTASWCGPHTSELASCEHEVQGDGQLRSNGIVSRRLGVGQLCAHSNLAAATYLHSAAALQPHSTAVALNIADDSTCPQVLIIFAAWAALSLKNRVIAWLAARLASDK